mgnify:CR=1 FL=1
MRPSLVLLGITLTSTLALACSDDGKSEVGDEASTDATSTDSTSDATSTDSSSTDATSTTEETGSTTCSEVQAEYELEVAKTDCSVDEDCKIILGHCGVGLGGCDYAVNVEVDEGYLDTLASTWESLGCTQGVCDCAPPPASAACMAGTCVGVP